MKLMDSKIYRLREFLNPVDGRSLIMDTSAGLFLGALPGLEHFSEAVGPILPLVDGIVASPGQARRLTSRTRSEAALLVRADWTNALRGSDFVLPSETISHMSLLAPADALDLGSSALVSYFLLGFEEQIEAACLRTTVQLALQGSQIGLPLVVDVQPAGPRVVLRSKAIELGVSYALEGGADGVVLPWPGLESFKLIQDMAAGTPVWIRPTSLEAAEFELEDAFQLGAAGSWLDERIFAMEAPVAFVEAMRTQVHVSLPQREQSEI
jgi:DhnA family fructose-bisphosphate aldolase class Ia